MSEVRDFKLDTTWADNATPSVGSPATPVQGTAYRDTTADFSDGWQFMTKAPTDVSNQLLYVVSKAIRQIQLYGTLGWNSLTTYPSDAMCWGSDGKIYLSSQDANTNHDPSTDEGTWWIALSSFASSGVLKAANGYENRVNGLQERWGVIYNGGTRYTHNTKYTQNFVQPFSNACFQVQLTQYTPMTNIVSEHSIPTLIYSTVNGFTWWPQNDDCMGVVYRAIGH